MFSADFISGSRDFKVDLTSGLTNLSATRFPRFLSALNLIKNRQATQATRPALLSDCPH